MAFRYRSVSRPALSFIKSSVRNPTISSTSSCRQLPSGLPRASRGIISLQSLLPFHSAVSSARLTSRLGFDAAAGSRSLCLGTLCSSNPGV